MSTFQHINSTRTRELLAAGEATVVDIRDGQSYQQGHIEGALHLDNRSLDEFLNTADKSRAVIVCCYHGISSQNAAQYLVEQGFATVFSLDGGFEGWRQSTP